MPPPLLIDLEKIDLSQVCMGRDEVYEVLPHRHEFALLDGVCHLDHANQQIVAFRDIRHDDWWFKGHVPGRPLLPGVLMLEMAAQAAALMSKVVGGFEPFIAFGGVDECKFREAVEAPSRLYVLASGKEVRARRIISHTQGVVDGRLIFEAKITGLALR